MNTFKVIVKLTDGERIYSYMVSDALNKFMNDISAGETFATIFGLAVRVDKIDFVSAELNVETNSTRIQNLKSYSFGG